LEDQFNLDKDYYLNKLDFLNWYRFYFIIKGVLEFKPRSILEIGAGSNIVKSCLESTVDSYIVLDINPRLKPDITGDVRVVIDRLKGKFDCVICADVLEHLPFVDLNNAVSNIFFYLSKKGKALVTIPHRRSNFLFMSPTQKPRVFTVPTGFLSWGAFYRRFIKRKIWIDPHHCWEIGDGKTSKRDVEQIFTKSGLRIVKFKKLLYVDFWVLEKV
jgi:hypothetical protein